MKEFQTQRHQLLEELRILDQTLTEGYKPPHAISQHAEEFCLTRIAEIKTELGGVVYEKKRDK